jgi:hypothetical protein
LLLGPTFELPGSRRDLFWVASRDAAWRAFFDLPDGYAAFMNATISDSEIWEALQCDDRSIEDDWMVRQLIVNHSAVGTKRYTPCRSSSCLYQGVDWSMRGCENGVLARPRVATESYIPYKLVSAGLALADSCPITGAFATSGTHNAFEVITSPHACHPTNSHTRFN